MHVINGSLDVLDELEASGQLARLSEQLNAATKDIAKLPQVARAESHGCLFGLTLTPEFGPNSGKNLEKLCFEKQVIVRGEEDWIALAPAYITTPETLVKIFEVLHEAIEQLQRS